MPLQPAGRRDGAARSGSALITLALFSVAIVNLFTKQVATISGVDVHARCSSRVFVVSERRDSAGAAGEPPTARLDQFQLLPAADVGLREVAAPGRATSWCRSATTTRWRTSTGRSTHTDTEKRDIVVMTVRLLQGPDTGVPRHLRANELFTDYEQLLFTRSWRSPSGRAARCSCWSCPSSNVFDAIAQTAVRLQSTEIVLGESAKFAGGQQARLLGEAWERIPETAELRTRVVTYKPSGDIETFQLGPHAPP